MGHQRNIELHHNAKNLTGKKFGTLTAIAQKGRDNQGRVFWDCKCDCGKTKKVRTSHLTGGLVTSCGCTTYQKVAAKVTHHGHSSGGRSSPTYRSWASMNARCSNPKSNRYHRYGGRGISICHRWRQFENFLADMGERPFGKTLDRIDVNGNYEPSNCKWSTPKEQAQNRVVKSPKLKPRKHGGGWEVEEF